MYGTTAELARILKIRTPTAEQTLGLTRALTSATVEIDAEIDLADDATALTAAQLLLIEEVAIERGVEHWKQSESPFGLVGIGGEFGATHTSRDSWDRHAHKLAPVKSRWGMA